MAVCVRAPSSSRPFQVQIPEKQNEALLSATRPHIDSFNLFLEESLPLSVLDLGTRSVMVGERNVTFWIESANIDWPTVRGEPLYPAECRQRKVCTGWEASPG